MGELVYLKNVRNSFPHYAQPHAPQGNTTAEKKYQGDFIMNPDDENWRNVWSAINKVAAEKWAEHAGAVINMINNDKRVRCYGQGAEKVSKKTMSVLDGYDGKVFVSAKNAQRPQIIKADGTAIDSANDIAYQAEVRKMYGGCRVNVALEIYALDDKNGRQIRGSLVALQFAGDDAPFGSDSTPDASHLFGQVNASGSNLSPAGAPVPQTTTPFGQPSATPDQGMPQTPFGAPGLPPGLSGD